jgi:glycosyltransferase involved in cell wall biosynthesis
MRVALLSYNAQAGDAIGNQVAEKLAFFLDRGADVRVLLQSDRRLHPAVRPHCQVLAAPEPGGDAGRFLASADLVVVEYGQYYPLLQLLPLLAGGKGRVLFDYHGVTPPGLWSAHNREAIEAGARQRGLVWCADAALAHSTFTLRELRDATDFPSERLFRLGHPIDREHFSPGPAARPLAEVLGLRDASVLLYVGRLAPNKRLPVLVEALAHLRDVTPPVHAVLIGDGGDLYRAEARRCLELANQQGVASRLHLLGRVTDQQLRDAYRSADVFVMPSRHEGFCIPVLEAMACGLPVVAARAAALPETVGGAGLTFTPDDAGDLARQMRRVLEDDKVTRWQGDKVAKEDPGDAAPGPGGSSPQLATVSPCHPQRVAVVAFRYGTDFVGGAETSLRTIAEALHAAGHHVEVFTTCTREENDWANQLPEGTTLVGPIPVHRFRLDPHDRARHLESVRAILQADGQVSAETEQEYLEHSIHSGRLLQALGGRQDEFDAVITGPYLFGLTLDVARLCPDRTLLLGCFHDEPFARLRAWSHYERIGGILYHSPEEQAFAEGRLGLNHPGAVCIDALVEPALPGNPAAAPGHVGTGQRYLVYCGRYSAQKGVPELLEYARRYLELHPDRFAFVFLGLGEVAIPEQPGLRNLGYVDDATRRDVVAGAAALVQLSRHESLSYAALEAWSEGTPVLADRRCEVLASHLRRCGGGQAVAGFDEFAQALDDLWERPGPWRDLGRRGREYVRTRYGSRQAFTRKLHEALGSLTGPLAGRMRARGLELAAQLDRARWREQFADLVEQLLDSGPRPCREQLDIQPRSETRTVRAGTETVAVPVRVVNRGSHAVLAEGPGRLVLRCRVLDETGSSEEVLTADTPLPMLLLPGRALAAAVQVPVPARAGEYRVSFQAVRAAHSAHPQPAENDEPAPQAWLTLIVDGDGGRERGCCGPLLETALAALVEAERVRQLPADYTDVTEGLLASWKRRIKQKLLNNFKHAYVDVLSRQQSAFNRSVLAALHELAECCATLDHAGQWSAVSDQRSAISDPGGIIQQLTMRLAESERRSALLEERLARLETQLAAIVASSSNAVAES